MLYKKIHILTIVVALVAVTALVGCYRTPEQRATHLVDRISDKLDLNADQKAKLNAIKEEFLAKAPAMRKAREESFDELIALMRAPKIDQDKVNTLMGKNKAQMDDLMRFISAKYIEFHDMLTPEQREKAAKEMEGWKRQHGGGPK